MPEARSSRGTRVPPATERPARRLVRLTVNGHTREVAVRPYDVLLDTIRHEFGLTGTTRGCDMGTCGCCTVHVDGVPTLSCLTLSLLAEDRDVRTIESVAPGPELHPVQRAFMTEGGSQCGFCTPGFIMTTVALLRDHPAPSDEEIRRAISGNMCRCTGYNKIVESVKVAAAELRGERRTPPPAPPGPWAPEAPHDKPRHAARPRPGTGGKDGR